MITFHLQLLLLLSLLFPLLLVVFTVVGVLDLNLIVLFQRSLFTCSAGAMEAVGIGSQGKNGFIAADIERSSLILCGKAFSDTTGIKAALSSLSGPIISARGGLPLSARYMHHLPTEHSYQMIQFVISFKGFPIFRLLVSGDSVILLFAPEDIVRSCSDLLASMDAGVILSSQGVAPFFQTRNSSWPNLYKLPAAVILASSDR